MEPLSSAEHIVISVALMVCSFFAAFAIGCYCGAEHLREEAVEAGVAEWLADKKTGQTEFVFLAKDEE